MQLTNLPNTHPTLENLMEKQFSIWFVTEEDSRLRNLFQAWPWQRIRMLLQRWFFWQLEQASRSIRPKYCQVTKWLDCVLCRMSGHLGIQVANTSRFIYYWSWVHHHVSITTRCSSYHVSGSGNLQEGSSSDLYQALHILQSFWRQLWCVGTHKASEASPSYQAHQRMLPALSRTRKERAYQDLPSRNRESNRRCPY